MFSGWRVGVVVFLVFNRFLQICGGEVVAGGCSEGVSEGVMEALRKLFVVVVGWVSDCALSFAEVGLAVR